MRTWLRTLRGRIIMATAAVALIAVVATAAASLPLVAFAVDQQVRRQLTTEAVHLAAVSPAALRRAVAASGPEGTRLAVVDPDGTSSGPASPLVTPSVRDAIGDRGAASTTVDVAGRTFVVVARPLGTGGSIVASQRVDDVVRTSHAIVLSVLAALLIGLAVALAVAIPLARAISRPLRGMAAAARRIARGERDVPAPSDTLAEIDDVASALAALDSALSASELRQREFLLSVSHEMRTPLTAVRGYAEALADGIIPAAEVTTVGSTLVAETARLDRFVADLLELARLEADDFTIATSEVDIAQLVDETLRAWRARADDLGVTLAASVGSTLRLQTDPMRLRQLLDGLVENALRAVPPGGHILIGTPSEDCIEVRDDGAGLTAADVTHAFERGVLRERYRHTRDVGTGLGLSIASRLAGRLGATLTAAPNPGGGAAFRVAFPSPDRDHAADRIGRAAVSAEV
jgi:two-component system, OmpR family, sensor kinase